MKSGKRNLIILIIAAVLVIGVFGSGTKDEKEATTTETTGQKIEQQETTDNKASEEDIKLLNSVIKNARGNNQELYTPETWSALEATCDAAEDIANSENPTEQQIKSAIDLVGDAVKDLQEK